MVESSIMDTQPQYLSLEEWAAHALRGNQPSVFTLRKYAREGRIEPPPFKVGKMLYVDRDATLSGDVGRLQPHRRAPERVPAAATVALYRHFDAIGQLLYVGISNNAIARYMAHRRDSHWSLDIATITIEHYRTRAEAEAAEAIAIVEERPRHNIAGVPA